MTFSFSTQGSAGRSRSVCLPWDQGTNLAGRQSKGKSFSFSRLLLITRREQVATVPVKPSIMCPKVGALVYSPNQSRSCYQVVPLIWLVSFRNAGCPTALLRMLTLSCGWESIKGPFTQEWSSTPMHNFSEIPLRMHVHCAGKEKKKSRAENKIIMFFIHMPFPFLRKRQ